VKSNELGRSAIVELVGVASAAVGRGIAFARGLFVRIADAESAIVRFIAAVEIDIAARRPGGPVPVVRGDRESQSLIIVQILIPFLTVPRSSAK
jgi:hypothetical protein